MPRRPERDLLELVVAGDLDALIAGDGLGGVRVACIAGKQLERESMR